MELESNKTLRWCLRTFISESEDHAVSTIGWEFGWNWSAFISVTNEQQHSPGVSQIGMWFEADTRGQEIE